MSQHKARPSLRRWVVMGLFWAQGVAASFVGSSLGVMLPAMVEELQFSRVEAGWLGSAQWLVSAASSLVAATWLSSYSPKRVVSAITLACVCFVAIQGVASTYGMLLLGRVGFAISAVGRGQAGIMLVQQWFATEEVALINSLQSGIFGLGQMVSIAATPFLLPLLEGWRHVYWAMAILIALFLLLWLILGAERHTEDYRARMARRGTPLAALRRHRVLWVVASCQIGSCIPYAAFHNFWPTFAYRERGFSLPLVGGLMSLFPLGSMAGSFLAGPLSSLVGLRKPFIWTAGFGLPLTYLGLVNIESVPILAALLLITGYFCLVVVPILQTFPFEMPELTPREVAVALGLMSTFTPLGGAVGPVLAGALAQTTGSLGWALGICGLLAPTLGIGGLLIPETGWRARKGHR